MCIRDSLRPYGGWKPLGDCNGWHPRGCHNRGYASSDIFFLEVCILSTICSNGAELFNLEENEDWQCVLDDGGYQQLKEWLLQPLQTSR